MLVTDLKERLDDEFQKYYKVVLVSGTWGIGKTYHLNKYTEDKENIKISLFGINNLDEFKLALYYELSKIGACINKIYTSWLKDKSINVLSVPIPLPNISVKIDNEIKGKLKGKKIILVIDDLERKSKNIDMKEFLGYVEALSKIESIQIIVVANEEKIEGCDIAVFKEFKEKVINKTYLITEYSSDAMKEICNDILGKNSVKKCMDDDKFKEVVISFFLKNKVKNLRTIEKAVVFSALFLNKVNIENLKEDDKINLLKICCAVVSDDCENRDNAGRSEKKIEDFIMNEYLNEYMLTDLKKYVILIRKIYLDIEIERSYQDISDNYLLKYSVTKSEKSIFYCNEEEVKNRIGNFVFYNIKKFNDKIGINTWFKGFNELYVWSKRIGYDNIFEDNEIFEIMDKYSEQIDIAKDFYDILDKYYICEIENKDVRKYYDILLSKMGTSYIKKCILSIKESLECDKYETEAFERIFNIIGRKIISNEIVEKEIIPLICKSQFFIPNINGDISEKEWGWCHTIWNRITRFDSSIIQQAFSEYTKQLLNEYTIIGKYRVNSLNNQYPII